MKFNIVTSYVKFLTFIIIFISTANKKTYSMLTIGIAGGSGSGKTTVVNKIVDTLPESSVSVIYQDAYYYDNAYLPPEEKLKINFDHPSSIEWDMLIKHLDLLQQDKSVPMPVYSYVNCSRSKEFIRIFPKKILIVEGILILTNQDVRDRLDIKVFVDADADDRLTRKIHRDMEERGRALAAVLKHYEEFVKPMHLQFIEPSKRYADIILPLGGENQVAIDLLAAKIKMNLEK